MSAKLSDEELMMAVKNGNLDALAPLFEKYNVRLFNFFLGMIRDKTTCEDLTQNVFQRILTYRESYNESWLFRSWMYQIARNVSAKHYKQQKLMFSDFTEADALKFDQRASTEEMDKQMDQEQLYAALNKLPYEQREILELARFQGLKYREIAEITGNSVPAIKVKVHRAIHKLRELFFERV